MKKLVIYIFFIIGYKSMGQTINTINKLEDSYQVCLDKGINMLECSKVYYKQMDSMLNVAYKKLQLKLSPVEFSKLKAEQLKWLSSRDNYFGNIILNPEEQSLGNGDKEMIIMDKKAEFIRCRVIELIKKI